MIGLNDECGLILITLSFKPFVEEEDYSTVHRNCSVVSSQLCSFDGEESC